MSNEHSWPGGMISQLDNKLLAAAGNDIFDPRYGLVGYGDRDTAYTTSEFQDILDKLNAHDITLNVLVSASYKCGDGRSASGLDAAGNGYVINTEGYDVCEDAYTTSGSGSAVSDYVDLALASGGSSWDIFDFRNGGAAFASMFSSTFIDVTKEQIEENQVSVSEAGTLAIFSLAIAGFFARSFSGK